jgi:hypothetical protein
MAMMQVEVPTTLTTSPSRQLAPRASQWGEVAGEVVGGKVVAGEFVAYAIEEWVDLRKERLRGEAVPAGVPHPFVAHGADAAFCLAGVGDAGECGGDHVAMLKGGGESATFVRIVAEPVEELGESPLMGVDAAAPLDGFEIFFVGEGGDFPGFRFRAVIAPEVVLIEGLHVGVDGNDAGAGGVEGDGGDLVAVDTGGLHRCAGRFGEGAHVVSMGLGCEVGIFAFAMERILGDGGAETAAIAVDDGDTHA